MQTVIDDPHSSQRDLLGFEFEDIVEHRTGSRGVKSDAFGLSSREIREIAALLDLGSSACFVLIEHVWARDLRRAIGETGGLLLGEGRSPAR